MKWGVSRIKGGFILLTLAKDRLDLQDTAFAVRAVEQHQALFGKPPEAYAYDRGGWSEQNVKKLRQQGVKQVGLAPRGKTKWAVSSEVKRLLVNERAKVEGSIGAIKNKPIGVWRSR